VVVLSPARVWVESLKPSKEPTSKETLVYYLTRVIVLKICLSDRFGAILGGSEEIMLDLGVRQAMKFFPPDAKL
jgi:hypothetical protein